MIQTNGNPNSPTPNYRRLMCFIDGENIVFNYQSLLKTGKKPKNNNFHLEDVFAWNKNIIDSSQFETLRVTAYTYAVGSEEKIKKIKKEIKDLTFNKDNKSILPNNLTPCVFKKDKKSKKTKGVDIKMTVDILINTYNDNLDTVYLIAGDGDYLPIIKEIRRRGKQVYLAFFSQGLNEELLNYVDKYICLDDIFFDN